MIARGGALLLIKRNLNPFIHPKGEAKAELVWCTVHPNPKTEILVSVVYRPERGGEHNLEAICNSISCIETDNIELSQIERGRILGRGAVKCNCSRHTSRGSQRIEGFCPGVTLHLACYASASRKSVEKSPMHFRHFGVVGKEYPFHRLSSQSTLRVSFHYLCRRLEMLFRNFGYAGFDK